MIKESNVFIKHLDGQFSAPEHVLRSPEAKSKVSAIEGWEKSCGAHHQCISFGNGKTNIKQTKVLSGYTKEAVSFQREKARWLFQFSLLFSLTQLLPWRVETFLERVVENRSSSLFTNENHLNQNENAKVEETVGRKKKSRKGKEDQKT